MSNLNLFQAKTEGQLQTRNDVLYSSRGEEDLLSENTKAPVETTGAPGSCLENYAFEPAPYLVTRSATRDTPSPRACSSWWKAHR